jgi:hypothetical protein
MDVDDYVHRQNLELYRKLLTECRDDDSRRATLIKLLADEKAADVTAPKGVQSD